MGEAVKKDLDKDDLPLVYRLLLKVPGADFLEHCSSGIFWAIIVPIFLIVEYSSSLILLVSFRFPINIIMAGLIPAAVLLVFLRISLERFINWWNLATSETKEWNIDKTVPEYLELLENGKEKKKPSS